MYLPHTQPLLEQTPVAVAVVGLPVDGSIKGIQLE